MTKDKETPGGIAAESAAWPGSEVKSKKTKVSVTPEFVEAKRRDAEIEQIRRRGGLV